MSRYDKKPASETSSVRSLNPFLSSDSELDDEYPTAPVSKLLGIYPKKSGSTCNTLQKSGSTCNLLQENQNYNPFTSSDSDCEQPPPERTYKRRKLRERRDRTGGTAQLVATLLVLFLTFIILLAVLIGYSKSDMEDTVASSNTTEPSNLTSNQSVANLSLFVNSSTTFEATSTTAYQKKDKLSIGAK